MKECGGILKWFFILGSTTFSFFSYLDHLDTGDCLLKIKNFCSVLCRKNICSFVHDEMFRKHHQFMFLNLFLLCS